MHKPSTSLADALLCPPPKFGQVEPSVFRAAFPRSESLAHLRLLGLRTALNLSRELPAQDILEWFEAQGVRVAHLGIAVWTHPSVAPISAECAFVCRVARSLRLSCRQPGRPARPE